MSHAGSDKHKSISSTRRGTGTLTSHIVKRCKPDGNDSSTENVFSSARAAEIRCVTRIVVKGRSFESESDLCEDLKAICPDSNIPSKIQLHKTKISYLLTEALFPYLREVILTEVKATDWYALHIDESNKGNKYLGIVLRYLPKDSFNVHSVCIDLPDLENASAESLATAVSQMTVDCGLTKSKCL